MFEWNPDPTQRGEVLQRRSDSAQPVNVGKREKTSVKTSGVFLTIGFCVTTALSFNCVPANGGEGSGIALHIDGPASHRDVDVPNRESWLYENADALAGVERGLAQATAGQFAPAPDMQKAVALANLCED